MSEEHLPREIFPLLESLCNESLTPEEHARLESILSGSRKSRRLYLRYVELHRRLKKMHRVSREVDQDDIFKSLFRESFPVTREGEKPLFPSRLNFKAMSAAVCVLGIAGLAAFFAVDRERPAVVAPAGLVAVEPMPEPHAESMPVKPLNEVILSQEAGAVFFKDETPRFGTSIRQGHKYSLLEGEIELAFPRGAKLILEGPAFFEVLNDERVMLTYGNCSVHAPPGAEGFEVLTPATQLIDRGTRFLVKVDEAGASEVHVIEGLVESVKPTEHGVDRRQLEEGQSKRYLVEETETEDVFFSSKSYRGQLPDRLLRYEGDTNERGEISRLTSLSVLRGGEPLTYLFDELIGCDVTSFCERGSPATVNFVSPQDYAGTKQDLRLHDDSFLTGILNPGGAVKPHTGEVVLPGPGVSRESLTPGMTLRFHEPVKNSIGPDLVIFDEQTAIHPLEGDAFHLRPLKMRAGMRPVTVRRFDIGMLSPEAKPMMAFDLLKTDRVAVSLDELFEMPTTPSFVSLNYRVLGTCVDLSSMGVPLGESIQELFLQDALNDEFRIDPVMIAGFRPVEERGTGQAAAETHN